jgi:enamine deaminase RidA (YjgF/YER057c/UK114 family)
MVNVFGTLLDELRKEKTMQTNHRRRYFNKVAAMLAGIGGVRTVLGQQTTPAPPAGSAAAGGRGAGSNNRVHAGIYYFPGIGSNSGSGRGERILVTDPFEKHVTRTMDALKKSLEGAGCTMDSILHLEVYICLPHAEGVPVLTGKAKFDAYTAHYQTLNKIYGTYFSPGRAPSRAFMAVDWIPGDSLVEVVGSARVVTSPPPAA